jgi:hypothetical protein
MNPYEPPPPTDNPPPALDVQHPRWLAWIVWLQVLSLSITALCTLLDTGVYGRVELWPPILGTLMVLPIAGAPLAVIGGLFWIVEVLRLTHRYRISIWFLIAQPLLGLAWFWAMLPLVQ